ncbi:hypothetical protein CEXT_647691 [Caerostris extrusa]|uniref:Uncharacterized protein n=1 Tax=Caerostris extrusa TaxID=172846 RepID=A0AAV4NVJ6_CAEEX|nr:hypothetical protein CEXT_647691 [Caerostris extrusa]
MKQARRRVGLNESCQYRWPCQKPKTSYEGTSSFVCAIEYQSSTRVFKRDYPKLDDGNRQLLWQLLLARDWSGKLISMNLLSDIVIRVLLD